MTARLSPKTISDRIHRHLVSIVPDIDDWDVDDDGADCSSGCFWFLSITPAVPGDWGLCVNPRSPRCGKLTWEHQGCKAWEYGDLWPAGSSEGLLARQLGRRKPDGLGIGGERG